MPTPNHLPPALELESLRVFVEFAPISMAILDRDLRYIAASRRWREGIGGPDISLVGKLHLEVLPNLPQKWRDIYVRCLQGEIASGDRDSYAPPGRPTVYFRWEVRPWHNAAGEIAGLIISSDNITSQVLTEDRERQSAALLRNFFTHSPLSMGVSEIDGDEFRFIQVNDVAVSHFGRASAAELEGKTPVELGRPLQGMNLWVTHARRALAEGRPVTFEYASSPNFFISVHVSPTPYPLGGKPRFSFIVRDITDERRAATARFNSEERLKFALQATDEGVWDWDVLTGNLQSSPRILEQLGLSPEHHVPTLDFWRARAHPEDEPDTMRKLRDLLDGRSELFEAEYRLRHQDGHYIWFLARGKIVKRDLEDNPLRIVGTQLDITRRKAQEEELRRAKEAALAASEAKSDFLANVSHEIRTPLAAILGSAEILDQGDLSPDKRAHFLQVVRCSGKHLMTLITSILDFSKIEAGKTDIERLSCDLSQLTADMSFFIHQRAAAKDVQFTSECPPQLRIFTDPTRLRQILTNLLDNAVKFTPSGGRVILQVHRDQTPPRIRFDIRDSGLGITPEQQARLFQPFAQADTSTTRRFGGTGLGLAISRRLARILGGDIQLQSSPGVGSCFTLWLPMDLPHDVPAAPETSSASHPPLHARILIAEDGEDIQMLLTHVLERAGATLVLVSDGAQALTEAQAAHDAGHDFDLILMDIQMPGMDGNTAATQLRTRGITTPIIALTAAGMESHRQQSLAAGCNDFLVKPFNTDRLLQLLARYIRPTTIPSSLP